MVEYKVSFLNPNSHILDIEVIFDELLGETLSIHLASWRPGRYELANYAKNILNLHAVSLDGENLKCEKVSKDEWLINTKGRKTLRIIYRYYAFIMDAGNSWLDDRQLYINPINCFVFSQDHIRKKCVLHLEVPASYKLATGLKEIDRTKFIAKDFYELADCPLIASEDLTKVEYLIGETEFTLWFNGGKVDSERIRRDFIQFTQYQVDMMGEFPEKDYHFLFQLLPYSFRHGVEHRNSTVITIGPEKELLNNLYQDFLGISSHELFHAWNVLKIRPKELTPYDFKKENYFRTGFIAEGLTTYYGDILLARAGVYSVEQYFFELNDLFQKHFDNTGNENMSIAESSFDLWLDGYVPGVPGRKVSIYIKGAVIAFLLDIQLRKVSSNKSSLDEVMRRLWKEFGKVEIGYAEADFKKIVTDIGGKRTTNVLDEWINGVGTLKKEVEESLTYLGLQLRENILNNKLESYFGIKCLNVNGKYLIDVIHPMSPAYQCLSKNDEIVAVNGLKYDGYPELKEGEIEISFFRQNRLLNESIPRKKNRTFFSRYSVHLTESTTGQQRDNLRSWLNLENI